MNRALSLIGFVLFAPPLFAQTLTADTSAAPFALGERRQGLVVTQLKPAIVSFDGQSLQWDSENSGGGRAVVSARLTQSGRIVGTEQVMDGHPMRAGFTPPEARIELVRALKKAP